MVVSRAAKQIMWMYVEMDKVGYPQEKPGILYNDNSGMVALTKNTKHNSPVKHIDIRHHFIHKCVEDRIISVLHVPSADNLANLFTKPLGCVIHQRACSLLCLYEDPPHFEQGGVL